MLSYNAVLGMAVCEDENCGHAVEVGSVLRHLREQHPTWEGDAQATANDLLQEQEATDSTQHLALRNMYHNAGGAEVVGAGEPLPALRGVKVRACLKCQLCPFVTTTKKLIRKHSCKAGNGHQAEPVLCKGQTLYPNNRSVYFEVFDVGAAVANPLEKKMVDLEGARPTGTVGEEVCRMDPWLGEMRFDVQLKHLGVSLDEAYELARWRGSSEQPHTAAAVHEYMWKAFDVTRQKTYIQAHLFMDAPLQLALSEATLEKYETRVVRLFSFLYAASCSQNDSIRKVFPADTLECLAHLQAVQAEGGEARQRATHAVLWSVLFTQFQGDHQVITAFISCASVFGGGPQNTHRKPWFGKAFECSPMLAALKYLSRCVVVMEVYVLPRHHSTLQEWDLVQHLSSEHADNGVLYVAHCMKKNNWVRQGEDHKIRFVVCPRHALCGILDLQEVSLPQLGQGMRQEQAHAWDLMREQLLHGLTITTDFWKGCENLQDVLTERQPGYWFGMHAANYSHYSHWRSLLLGRVQHMLYDAGGKVMRKEGKTFLDSCEQLQAILCVLLQVCSGGPGRATELSVVQVCNTAEAQRHLFVSGGRLFFVPVYHKSQGMQQGLGKPIVRFPDAVTAGILLVYLFVIRPVEVLLVHDMFEHRGPEQRNWVFASRGSGVSADRLRGWFTQGMQRAGVPLSTNQYRQFYSGAVKHFLHNPDDLHAGPTSRAAVMHKQAGHTEHTAHTIYGLSDTDMRLVKASDMEAYKNASVVWQCALGLVHGAAAPLADNDETEDKVAVVGKTGCSCVNRIETVLLSLERRIDDLTDAVRQQNIRRPNLKRVLSLEDSESPARPEKSSRGPSDVDLLRLLLDNDTAEFRSKEQETAVAHAMRPVGDCLVVLPTGTGKSAVFELPAWANPNTVSIVVVPLVALRNSLAARCRASGVQAAEWKDRDQAGVRIVFASVEHVDTSSYSTYVAHLHQSQRLRAIYIDEAHLVVTWKTFRPLMAILATSTRPQGITCPLFALTATAPPTLADEIAESCGLKQWTTVRSRTSRGNIRYDVTDVSDPQCMYETLSTLRETRWDPSDKIIVYTPTRALCSALRGFVQVGLRGIGDVVEYHAGLPDEERRKVEDMWEKPTQGKYQVVFCTNAFGCGIHASSVRCVIHAGRPRRLGDFLQESGRAGRDGKPALSLVFNVVPDPWPPRPEDEKFGKVTSLQGNSAECRRWALDLFADGVAETQGCASRGMQLCDVCARLDFPSPKTSTKGAVECGDTDAATVWPAPRAIRPASATKQSRAAFALSGTVKTESVSPSGLTDLVEKWTRLCAPCSIRDQAEVLHGVDNPRCFRSRCFKCGTGGHDSKGCPNIPRTHGTCFECSLTQYGNLNLHRPGEFGSKQCRVKNLLRISFCAWERPTLQASLRRDVPGMADLTTTAEFSLWVRGATSSGELGLAAVLPWVNQNVFSSERAEQTLNE